MRFNDKELVKVSEVKSDLEGILYHMKPQGNDWSEWYQPSQSKERYFKLKANLLFYYRVNDLSEPLGVLILENAQVAYERPHKGISFAFSLTFKVDRLRDSEAKHIFSCRCESDVSKWVTEMKMHSYEYWRSQFIILNTKISMKTGQDPVLNYMRSKNGVKVVESVCKKEVKKVKEKKATFYSHVESATFYESSHSQTKVVKKSSNVVDNLIDL